MEIINDYNVKKDRKYMVKNESAQNELQVMFRGRWKKSFPKAMRVE